MYREYDDFHKNPKIQIKVISKNNFTYRNNLDLLDKYIGKKRPTILDYGCGVGTVDFYLANKAAYILGLDLSQKAISICRASAKAIGVSGNTKFEVINQNIDTKFDFIICAEVIEHVVDDRQLLQKFSGILRKKGILFLSTPSVNAPLFRLHLANSFDKNVGHLRRYDEVKLKKMLNYANFKVLESRKTEGVLRNALFVVPSLNWIVKFLRGPLSDLVTLIDNFLVDIFGESNILIVAQKK